MPRISRSLPYVMFDVDKCELGIESYLYYLRHLKGKHSKDRTYCIKLFGQKWTMPLLYAIMAQREQEQWEKYYLPNFSLEGKTVLDVGAGAGETALFYLKHGAKKVIAIEINPFAIHCLAFNVMIKKLNIEISPVPFKLEHITEEVDFMKCDIEGGEKILLNSDKLPPSIIEVNGKELITQFVEKFDMKDIRQPPRLSLMGMLTNIHILSNCS